MPDLTAPNFAPRPLTGESCWSHCGSLDWKDKKRVGEGIASTVDSFDFAVDSAGPVPYALYSDPDHDRYLVLVPTVAHRCVLNPVT